MVIGKTVIVKSAPNLDEKVNAKIQELKNEYKLVQIINVKEGLMLCLEPINHAMGPVGNKLHDATSDLATSKQLNYLKRLATDDGLADIDLNTLTKRQAGQLIGKFKKQHREVKAGKSEEDDFKPSFNMSDLNKMNFD